MNTAFNYTTIKEMAARTNAKIIDFLALAPKNDPFYTGTPGDHKQGEWFASIWQKAGYMSGVHLRRVHYWAVSQSQPVLMHSGEPYENTEKCWDYLVQASKTARYLGLVRIADIMDKKNPNPHINAWYGFNGKPGFEIILPDLNEPQINIEGLSSVDAQPYHLEIWCEKSTMDDVLKPACSRWGANLCTFEGEVSITACHSLIERIKQSGGKPTRVWYISDFDPAGNSMPVATSRKVEYMLRDAGLDYDVKIKPIVLTAEQVAKHKLPRIPIKETERRAGKFEQAFGTGAVELDAMEALYPGTLGKLIDAELRKYHNKDAASEVQANRAALYGEVQDEIDAITARYKAEIEAVKAMFEELRDIDVNAAPYAVERFKPHVKEADDWLFDSQRDYTDQIRRYKQHKLGGEE